MLDKSSNLGGLGWHAELIFQSLEVAKSEWEQHVKDVERDREHFAKQDIHLSSSPVPPTLFTGGCASNNDSKGVELPSSQFDAVLYNDGEETLTIHEIRRAFSYAGFPVLVQWEQYQEQLRHLILKPDIDRLLPALTKDLLEV